MYSKQLKKAWDNMVYVLPFLLFITLPFNLRKYFPIEESFVGGRFVEYRTPALFITDFVLLAIVGYVLAREDLRKKWIDLIKQVVREWGIIVLITVTLSIFLLNEGIIAYPYIRLAFYALATTFLFILISRETIKKFLSSKKFYLFFLITIILLLLLQLVPYAYYLLYIQCSHCTLLGVFDPGSISQGAAQISIGGREITRNYGYFPHPNVLGGFTVFLSFLVGSFQLAIKHNKDFLKLVLTLIFSYVALIVLISSFSLSAFLALLFGGITVAMYLFYKENKTAKAYLSIGLRVFSIIFIAYLLGSFLIEAKDLSSFEQRMTLNYQAIEEIIENPISGVGLTNFLVEAGIAEIRDPNGILLLQPVHNIFLLTLAELGLIFGGFSLYKFGQVLYKSLGTRPELKISMIVFIITIGMVDHYLLTLNQGILMTILAVTWLRNSQ